MGRAPLHFAVAEQAQISVMHQLGSSLHMISQYVKKSRSAIRPYLNNLLYYGKKKSTGRPRKVTSRDERNIIRTSPILQRTSTTFVQSSIFLFVSRKCTMKPQEVERLFDRT
uniref:HTH_Tnp_Tc3_1 domain-containing protein n=1 Tax=Caenorhabditis japonica TaxID=281687 RepID=A0A8R1HUC4_CAEJA